MKPHPRIRKTIKWGGVALAALLAVVWIGSLLWTVHYTPLTAITVWCGSGSIDVIFIDSGRFPPEIPGWGISRNTHGIVWRPRLIDGGGWWYVYIPLWLPLLAILAITALAFRLDTLARRRSRLHLCPKCHYDRTGLAPDAVCPECGTGSAAASPVAKGQ